MAGLLLLWGLPGGLRGPRKTPQRDGLVKLPLGATLGRFVTFRVKRQVVKLITDSAELAEFCARLSAAEFVTVDTEFMRERTYWPRLCLVQLAGADEYAGVDPLAPDIDLDPLLRLMNDGRVLKV